MNAENNNDNEQKPEHDINGPKAGETEVLDKETRETIRSDVRVAPIMKENMETRFASEHLVSDSKIESDTVVKDAPKLGDRWYSSPEKGYLDPENRVQKAGVLVSRKGQELLIKYHSLLGDIDTALTQLPSANDTEGEITKKAVTVGQAKVRMYAAGGQSSVYLCEVSGKKLIVKTRRRQADPVFNEAPNTDQPYIYEMLQVQNFVQDNKQALEELGVEFPEFIFATSEVSCTEYIKGQEVDEGDEGLEKIHPRLSALMENYVAEQRKAGKPLWNNVRSDLEKLQVPVPMEDRTGDEIKVENFRKRKKKYVVVDPFCNDPMSLGERRSWYIGKLLSDYINNDGRSKADKWWATNSIVDLAFGSGLISYEEAKAHLRSKDQLLKIIESRMEHQTPNS